MAFYPDTTATALRNRLAKLYDISADEIITANGADNILTLLISAYINAGDEVIYCIPTFPSYRSTTLLMGGVPVEVPLTKSWQFDLDGIFSKITAKTKLIFICNPNNPTGTMVPSDELKIFLEKVPDHVQVVLDEAYIEYRDQEDYLTGIVLHKKSYPVIVVRTFSKFYGLAGLRIGYAVACEDVLEPLLRIREPFAANRIAIEAAVAALDDEAFGRDHLLEVKKGKDYLTKELSRYGFEVVPSQTNFLFVNLKTDAVNVFEQLLSKGIIIRPCAPWGYPEHVRISVGTQAQNEEFTKAFSLIATQCINELMADGGRK
ncbi:histidinol-phosphate transaminase [Virgibacillus sp. 179-BFC.A HS]|uniref:Histidinol-phosphate transaminase n=1 Tax=Tigheibacillus jepli TaxID=3035914 RepID=A0ABU5CIY5_9BACI|nr:histidinol-phosphate transaminase [Virgibacillus sp. 179-BFC.A HS]MDY0406311.1 histidinol-phosphate transaminase [Virgibacillus sp. 179-BFC.A HS]